MKRARWWVWALAWLGCSDNTQLLDASADTDPSKFVDVVDAPSQDRGADVLDAATGDLGGDAPLDATRSDDVTRDAAETSTDAAIDVTDIGDVVTSDRAAAADTAPADAAPADATPSADASADVAADATRDAVSDAPAEARGTPTLDGRIGDDWPAAARIVRNTVASPWGGALNALQSLRVAWDDDRLYLGVEGAVEDTNAILVFVDRDYIPGSTATGVTRLDRLTDGAGLLDDAVSCGITTLPAGFGVDLVWGTRGMRSKAATDLVDGVGLRDVACATCAGDFRWVRGDTVACVRTPSPACEVGIAWTSLYDGARPPPLPRIGVFVRIANGAGADLSNHQCLPEQSPPDDAVVRSVLELSPSL